MAKQMHLSHVCVCLHSECGKCNQRPRRDFILRACGMSFIYLSQFDPVHSARSGGGGGSWMMRYDILIV